MVLIDTKGRMVPTESDYVYEKEDRNYFVIQKPELDISEVYKRFESVFEGQIEVSREDFSRLVNEILSRIQNNSEISNILNGPYFPFLIPRNVENRQNILEFLIEKLKKSFENFYPNYEFKNFANQIDEDSYINSVDKVIKVGNFENKSAVGLYFPSVLTGYSIYSQRLAFNKLGQDVFLGGPFDTISALIGNPGMLVRHDNSYPSGLVLSGINPKDKNFKDFFWYFEAYGWNLNFNYRSMIGPASEYFTGGISFLA